MIKLICNRCNYHCMLESDVLIFAEFCPYHSSSGDKAIRVKWERVEYNYTIIREEEERGKEQC